MLGSRQLLLARVFAAETMDLVAMLVLGYIKLIN